jgi:hypothetical protein
MKQNRRYLFLLQGGYYLIAGCWPFISIESFQAVTGWQNEIWLIKMVAALVIAFSIALLWQSLDGRRNSSLQRLALMSAVFFAATGMWHYFLGGMNSILLVDPLIEVGFAIAGRRLLRSRRRIARLARAESISGSQLR